MRVPNFTRLMTNHIMSARKVVRGKFSGNKKLVQQGLSGLSKNTKEWGKAVGHCLGKTKGKRYQTLWGEHVALEGAYIGAIFSCKCNKKLGSCMKAKKARAQLRRLKNNGKKLTRFLGQEFGMKRVWDRLWKMHLHCVKKFIDLGKRVDCKKSKVSTFDASVKSCVNKGKMYGRAMERLSKKRMAK